MVTTLTAPATSSSVTAPSLPSPYGEQLFLTALHHQAPELVASLRQLRSQLPAAQVFAIINRIHSRLRRMGAVESAELLLVTQSSLR